MGRGRGLVFEEVAVPEFEADHAADEGEVGGVAGKEVLEEGVDGVAAEAGRPVGGRVEEDGADEALEGRVVLHPRAEVDGDAGFCAGGGQEAAGAAEQGGFAVGEQVAGDVGVGGDAGAFVDERGELGRGHVDEASEHEFFFGAEEGSEPGDEVDDAGIEEGVAHFAAGAESTEPMMLQRGGGCGGR